MSLKKVALSLVLMLAVAAIAAPSFVGAADTNETLVTFHQPIGIPGIVLPSGSYLFKATGPVVQVFDADQDTLFATLLTVPAYREDSSDKPEFELEERVAGAPKAIDAWYFKGGSIGGEFVYPEVMPVPAPPLPNSTFAADPSTHWWAK